MKKFISVVFFIATTSINSVNSEASFFKAISNKVSKNPIKTAIIIAAGAAAAGYFLLSNKSKKNNENEIDKVFSTEIINKIRNIDIIENLMRLESNIEDEFRKISKLEVNENYTEVKNNIILNFNDEKNKNIEKNQKIAPNQLNNLIQFTQDKIEYLSDQIKNYDKLIKLIENLHVYYSPENNFSISPKQKLLNFEAEFVVYSEDFSRLLLLNHQQKNKN